MTIPTTTNLRQRIGNNFDNIEAAVLAARTDVTLALDEFEASLVAARTAVVQRAQAVRANPVATQAEAARVISDNARATQLEQEGRAAVAQNDVRTTQEVSAQLNEIAATAPPQPVAPVTPASQPTPPPAPVQAPARTFIPNVSPTTPPAPAPAVTVNQVNGPLLFEWDRPGNPPGETLLQRDWSSGLMQLRDGMNNHENRIRDLEDHGASQPNWGLGGIVAAVTLLVVWFIAGFLFGAGWLLGFIIAAVAGLTIGLIVAIATARPHQVDHNPNNE